MSPRDRPLATLATPSVPNLIALLVLAGVLVRKKNAYMASQRAREGEK